MSVKRPARQGPSKWQQKARKGAGCDRLVGGREQCLSSLPKGETQPLPSISKAFEKSKTDTGRDVLKEELQWLLEELARGPTKIEEGDLPPSKSTLRLPPAVLLQGFHHLSFQPLTQPAESPLKAASPLPLKAFAALRSSCSAAKPVDCRGEAVRARAGAPQDLLSSHLERALRNQQRAKEARNLLAAAADTTQGEGGNLQQQQQQHGPRESYQWNPNHLGAGQGAPQQVVGGAPMGGGDGGSVAYRQAGTGAPGEGFLCSPGERRHEGQQQGGPFGGSPCDRQLDSSGGWAPSRRDASSSSSSSSRYHLAAGDYDAWAGPVAVSTVQYSDWESRSFPWDAEIQRINRSKSVINAVLSARDVFVMMPTGGGKSLCFQLPALVSGGVTAVVMPLLSLMQDQMEQLQELGVECRAFTSNQSWEEQRQVYEELRDEQNAIHLVFLTPEKLSGSKALRSALHDLNKQGRLSRFAVDEAHCVSQWGNDFRPDYCQLRRLREEFPNVPIVALTATATVAVLQDVQKQLGMREPVVFQRSFDRPNLRYEVLPKQRLRAVQQVVELIMQNFRGLCGIVYCLSQRDCERVAEGLEDAGISAAYYHAKLNSDKREHVQRSWMENRYKVIVATLAFGMGVNKKDVRFVIHTAMPKSLENFYQASDRTSWDGEEARCILLYDYHDKQRQTFLMQAGSEGRRREAREQQGQQNASNLLLMLQYCEELFECRRVFILRHFGEDFRGTCDTECDNCKRRRSLKPHVVACGSLAKEVVALVRGLRSKSPSFPLTLASLRDALLGRKAKGIKYQELVQAHSQFGCLQRAKWTPAATARLLHSLVIHEVLWERCVASSNQQGSFTTYIELGRRADEAGMSVQSLVMDEPPTGTGKRSTKADGAFPQSADNSSPPCDGGEAPAKKARVVFSANTNASYPQSVMNYTAGSMTSAPQARGAEEAGHSGGVVGGLSAALAESLRKRLSNVREDLAKRASLRTTKSIASNAAVEAMVRHLPTTLAQLQALPFKELQGGKKGEKYGQILVAEVRAFLCENRMTHLLREDARGMPPPGVSLPALPATENTGDEEFVSVGGPTEPSLALQESTRRPSCSGTAPGGVPFSQTCVSQSVYFKARASTDQLGAFAAQSTRPGFAMTSSQRGSSSHQQQSMQCQQRPATLVPPPPDGGGQSTYAAPDLWDPEDLDYLDYL
ncbi:hypothetical protein Esti_001553 [Eimeria stiedai]